MLNWFHSPGYAQGVFWIMLVSLLSNMNDILMRLLGSRLDGMEIAFFRFFFAAIVLLPIMLYQGKSAFKTALPGLHVLRALLGFGAVSCWCYGVTMAPLSVVATLALTVPIFVLPMAYLLLGEPVGWARTTATLAGFIGILVIVIPQDGGEQVLWQSSFNAGAMILIMAAILFAISDILNKKMVKHESVLAMLFYFAFGTSLAGAIPAWQVWQTPNLQEFMFLFLLGMGGNLILFCLLKAFAATQVSALAPYRYLELIFATVFGYLLFGEIPGSYVIIGAAIIIPSTLMIALYETKKKSDAPKDDNFSGKAVLEGS